jgi:hypothetical protein
MDWKEKDVLGGSEIGEGKAVRSSTEDQEEVSELQSQASGPALLLKNDLPSPLSLFFFPCTLSFPS